MRCDRLMREPYSVAPCVPGHALDRTGDLSKHCGDSSCCATASSQVYGTPVRGTADSRTCSSSSSAWPGLGSGCCACEASRSLAHDGDSGSMRCNTVPSGSPSLSTHGATKGASEQALRGLMVVREGSENACLRERKPRPVAAETPSLTRVRLRTSQRMRHDTAPCGRRSHGWCTIRDGAHAEQGCTHRKHVPDALCKRLMLCGSNWARQGGWQLHACNNMALQEARSSVDHPPRRGSGIRGVCPL